MWPQEKGEHGSYLGRGGLKMDPFDIRIDLLKDLCKSVRLNVDFRLCVDPLLVNDATDDKNDIAMFLSPEIRFCRFNESLLTRPPELGISIVRRSNPPPPPVSR